MRWQENTLKIAIAMFFMSFLGTLILFKIKNQREDQLLNFNSIWEDHLEKLTFLAHDVTDLLDFTHRHAQKSKPSPTEQQLFKSAQDDFFRKQSVAQNHLQQLALSSKLEELPIYLEKFNDFCVTSQRWCTSIEHYLSISPSNESTTFILLQDEFQDSIEKLTTMEHEIALLLRRRGNDHQVQIGFYNKILYSLYLITFLLFLITIILVQKLFRSVRHQQISEAKLSDELALEKLRLQAIFKEVVDPIVTINAKGIILSINQACCDVFQYKEDELLGVNISILTSPEHKDLHDSYLQHHIRTGEKRIIGQLREVKAQKKNGELVDVELSISRVDFSDDLIFMGILRDISSRKENIKLTAELSWERMRLQAIIKNVVDPIITINAKGIIQSTNQAVKNIFGYEDEELMNRNIKILTSPEHRDLHDQYIQHHLQTGERRIIGMVRQVQACHKDGHLIDVELSISRISIGDDILFVGILRDISDRQKLEEKTREAIQAAEDNAKAKNDFLTNMTHEIKTPLNGIYGASDILSSTDLDPEQAQCNRIIQNSIKALKNVVEDILDLSKLQAGKMSLSPHPFQLQQTLQFTIDVVTPQAEKKGLELILETKSDPAWIVKGDEKRLQQVILNLLSNAIKFTNQGHVKITMNTTNIQENNLAISIDIEDTGIGISPKDQKMIFDQFSQADSSKTRDYEGTGLGLTISKKITELMQGHIELKSEEGKGSTFSLDFCLPIIGKC
jgi:PAS domain S-box-containing protein